MMRIMSGRGARPAHHEAGVTPATPWGDTPPLPWSASNDWFYRIDRLERSRRTAIAMTDTLKPRDSKDVEDAVQSALADGKTLEIVGGGSKRALGRPAPTDLTLDLSRLAGVTLYEPEELVLSARAGTPLAEIEALIAAKGQMLAFEPMDFTPVLGTGSVAAGRAGAAAGSA